jgi:hypothetical protein
MPESLKGVAGIFPFGQNSTAVVFDPHGVSPENPAVAGFRMGCDDNVGPVHKNPGLIIFKGIQPASQRQRPSACFGFDDDLINRFQPVQSAMFFYYEIQQVH